ncbi:hypothetical protein ICN48_06615 [Polynucleobacter sp. JS-Safj-400b-B2]|uniref:hypothetical protein n=1 Tax=Polynucleobacter sp. JS-Safj-400b-B2 TaxID=2576921 RepID=UPI001C0AC15B|nr:hypothetical protein [Polynucleobacter sp. JS-Safj-400b-B2]MBU3625905.1 hypothetical protein [Polynucleobacter sp. JS-Safj-400b-B2]
MSNPTEQYWVKKAEKQFLGKRIIGTRYLTEEEMNDLGWTQKCVVLHLDDGNIIFPSVDDEGNDAGALFTNNKECDTFPVIRS